MFDASQNARAGFSLVELAIVLVVVGLLVSGTMIGINLMEQAKVKAVIDEFRQMDEAVAIFEEKYYGLPGDLPAARDYWPDCDATPANCNGNGDSRIDPSERYRAMQQLGDAGLIPGQYTGTGGANCEVGVNVPQSKYDTAGLALGFVDAATSYTTAFWGGDSEGNSIFHGRCGDTSRAPVMPPEHALQIDEKMDDGQPGTGNIQGNNNTATTAADCYTAGTPAAAYRITNAGPVCSIHYIMRHTAYAP